MAAADKLQEEKGENKYAAPQRGAGQQKKEARQKGGNFRWTRREAPPNWRKVMARTLNRKLAGREKGGGGRGAGKLMGRYITTVRKKEERDLVASRIGEGCARSRLGGEGWRP